MTRYAAKTDVSSAKSKAEIELTVERYGASQFLSGWDLDGRAVVGFTMEDRQVRFVLQLPDRNSNEFTHSSSGPRSADTAGTHWEQACRQRWRALALVIKAKLEAVESGIAIFEDEFMANIVLPNGRLVGEEIRPAIANAYATGEMPPLLPNYTQ